MEDGRARVQRIVDWIDHGPSGHYNVSLIPYQDSAMQPFMFFSLYSPSTTFCIYKVDSRASRAYLLRCNKKLREAVVPPLYVQDHQNDIAKHFPQIADSEEALLKFAAQTAKEHALPLACILFGDTPNLHEPFFRIYTQFSLRIDRALTLFQKQI